MLAVSLLALPALPSIAGADRDAPALAAAMEQGVVAPQSSRHARAERYFTRVIEAEPGHAEVRNRGGTVRYLCARYARSAADVRRTLAPEPRHFAALAGPGLVCMQLERCTAAIEAFERVPAINRSGLNHGNRAPYSGMRRCKDSSGRA